MWRIFLIILIVGVVGTEFGGEALAGGNDLQLNQLASCKDGTSPGPAGGCIANVDYTSDPNGSAIRNFEALSKSLGRMFVPGVLAPAGTLGLAGHSTGVEYKLALPDSGEHWKALNAYSDKSGSIAPDPFSMLQFHLRKGLPFSFELEGMMNWLLDSQMMWVGGSIKWTVLEDVFLFVPDVAVRGHGGTVIGAPDMSITTAGVDFSLSKSFGVFGIFNLSPYAGGSLLWIFTSSRVLDVDPNYSTVPTGPYSPEFVFDNTTQSAFRGFGGLRFMVSHFALTAEFSTDGEIHNIGANLGATF